MKHSTITDIAKILGISPSTVSRALRDHPDICLDTKNQVKKIAKELNFTPNPIAQSLKNNRTTTIGVIVPEIKHDFFSSAISGIEEVAYQSGYTIIVCQSNESFEREIVNTNVLIHHRVAGIIVSISQNTKNGDHFKDIIERKIPLVFFDRVCEDVSAYKVIIDDSKSAFDAVNYLISKGYKKIVHLAGPMALDICKKRMKGYTEALEKAGIEVVDELVLNGGLHEQDGYNSMEFLIKEKLPYDAIFAVNDPVAIGAFQRIKEAGLRIPEDVAIIGFSNNKITNLVDPPLTTVDQPSFEMGMKAAEILIGIIEKKNKSTEPKTLVLNTRLIVRGST
ncbi:MAG: LacI family DNA-binding transcriptional regulator [Ignavibacteriales bacterium]|nr:LacI family DNA-binding transcriptional regulator [Ignavibacteriales bacterium]